MKTFILILIALHALFIYPAFGIGKCDPNDVFDTCDTDLMIAIQNNDMQEVNRILNSKVDINETNRIGEAALAVAIRNQNEEIALALLEHGANPTMRELDHIVPLHLAARYGLTRLINKLIQMGADVNAITVHGSTPLHYGGHSGEVQAVELLIQNGADIHAVNDLGDTPLLTSLFNDDEASLTPVVQAFLENGANPLAENTNGITTVSRAQELHKENAQMLEIVNTYVEVENAKFYCTIVSFFLYTGSHPICSYTFKDSRIN